MSRVTPSRAAERFYAPVAAATTIEAGTLVARNAAGYLVPGSVATTLKKAGVARETITNSGSAGDVSTEYDLGCFLFDNSADTDEITIADIGNNCYIVNSTTVAKTNGTNTRSVAGQIIDVEASGVWVHFK
jgi:hypothetical protein